MLNGAMFWINKAGYVRIK